MMTATALLTSFLGTVLVASIVALWQLYCKVYFDPRYTAYDDYFCDDYCYDD
jgi:hypothetical protein